MGVGGQVLERTAGPRAVDAGSMIAEVSGLCLSKDALYLAVWWCRGSM